MRAGILGLCLIAAGCKAPSLAINLDLPDGYAAADLTLAVSVYAPGGSADITCDAIAYGDYTDDQLLPSLALRTALTGESGELGTVPRLGRKLIVVDGSNAEGVTVVGGCGELGELTKRTELTIALEVATRVVLDPSVDTLEAEVEFGGVSQTNQHVVLTVVDASNAPVAGTAVRASTIGPSGRVLLIEPLVTDVSGGLEHAPTVRFSGPFAVEYAVRFGLDSGPPRVPGFSINAEPVVDPFASLPNVKWATPARIGSGAGFVAIRRADSAQVRWEFVSAPLTGFSGNRAQFGPLRQAVVGDRWEFPVPVGDDFHVENGPPYGLARLLQHTDVSAGTWHFLPRFAAISTSDPGQQKAIVVPTTEELPASNAVPLGSCAPGSDPAGLPLLVAFATPAQASNAIMHLAVTTLDAHVGFDASFYPRSSHCVVDGSGARHRVLVGRQLYPDSDYTELAVVDLGTEPIGLGSFDLTSAKSQPLPLARAVGGSLGSDGQPRLLVVNYGGFSMLLEEMRISDDPLLVLQRERTLTTTVPANTFEITTGSLVEAGRHDYVALLDFGVSEVEVSPVYLFAMTAVDDAAHGPLIGGRMMPSCSRFMLAGIQVANCKLLLVDVDNDGRQEALLSFFNLLALGRTDIPSTGMLVLRFGEW